MRDAWEGSISRYAIATVLLVPLGFAVSAVLYLDMGHEGLITMAMVMGPTYTILLVTLFLARRQFMELWPSNRKFVAVRLEEAQPRLAAAMASSGQPYREVAASDQAHRAKYEVGRGLVVEMFEGKGKENFVIYVWPVNDRTRRDVDGLKRSIDAAFPPVK